MAPNKDGAWENNLQRCQKLVVSGKVDKLTLISASLFTTPNSDKLLSMFQKLYEAFGSSGIMLYRLAADLGPIFRQIF